MNFEERKNEALKEIRQVCRKYKIRVEPELESEFTEDGTILAIQPTIVIEDDTLSYTSDLVKN